MARYGERYGSESGTGDNRDRWRDIDRERSDWNSRQGPGEPEERGFFQRAGDEIRSWFNEDDERRFGRDYERDPGRVESSWSPMWERDREKRFQDRDRFSRENRSSFGGIAQSGYDQPRSGVDYDRERGFRQPRDRFERRDRLGSSNTGFGGFREEGDFRSHRHHQPQGWSDASRGQGNWDGGQHWNRDRDRELGNPHLGYGDFGGTLGGFGNQTFGSSQDDHYRSWRDRQMSQLDSDYADYCREREQQFNQDFDSWRRNRSSQNPTATATSPDLGSSSNAGVGTTTASVTGSAGSGTTPASATTQGGAMQSEATETAGSGSSRSGSRSRS